MYACMYRLYCCAKTEIIKCKPAENFNSFGKTLILSLLLLLLLLYKHIHMYTHVFGSWWEGCRRFHTFFTACFALLACQAMRAYVIKYI